MYTGDNILVRVMELSRSIQQEKDAKNASSNIEENINRLRNTFFSKLSKCSNNDEKGKLILGFISESKRLEAIARKNNNPNWIEIYSKFHRETLHPLKDFTIIDRHVVSQSELSSIKPSGPPIAKPKDDRIACTATPEQILEYFMILSRTLWNGKPIMSAQDVAEFCAANFVGFEKPAHFRKFPLNIKNQKVFIYFLRLFFSEFGPRGSKKKYANLLVKNFNEFAKANPENILTNFSKQPRKTDMIPTAEFFRKIKPR